MFRMEKLEWCGYFRAYVQRCDGRTDW